MPPDGMNQSTTRAFKAALYHRAKLPKSLWTDVFEHADRHEDIELTRDVPVIAFDELDTITQSGSFSPFARKNYLLVGNIVGLHCNAIVLRHVQRQRAPATACIDDCLPGL